jgi:hypothetical protein
LIFELSKIVEGLNRPSHLSGRKKHPPFEYKTKN